MTIITGSDQKMAQTPINKINNVAGASVQKVPAKNFESRVHVHQRAEP